MRSPLAAAFGFLCLPLLPACALLGASPRDTFHGEPGPAHLDLTSFHGWRRCGQLANGLVRATVVPQTGGRTLEYALDGYNYLFIGEDELGAVLADRGEPRYHHFGGQFAQLHPEDRWVKLRSSYPPDLFMGRYELHALPSEAGKAAVELTSPVDLATGTRIVRRVELFPASTHLRITDTLTNVRLVPQDWGIQAILQLKGVSNADGLVRREDPAKGAIALYVPLNARSRFKGGVRFALGGPGAFETAPGLLTLRYRRQFGKALMDPALPWVAFVDHATDHVFVQTCAVPEKAVLSAGGAFAPYPFIEVQSLGQVARLGPGQSVGLVQDWYAARCPGPVVDITDAGVVAAPLSLLRGQGGTWLAGTFGLFAVGRAAVVFHGANGAEVARFDCGAVTPLRPFVLNRTVDVPAKATRIALEVRDPAGNPVGHLGRIDLPPR
ncbi:MAG TPA: hypothetical protein VNE39_03475 [Planctomycetota bacterium]|nr:hypothetical protein [Planctomycetota bacterium]